MQIELILADPHPVMLDGLSKAFQELPEFTVQACVSHGDEALDAVQQYKPDILVMDLSLSQRGGVSLIEAMNARQLPTQVVVFTSAPIGEVLHAIDMGVSGLVAKDKSQQVLAECIKSVHQGEKWLDRDLTLQTMSLLLEQQKTKAQTASVLTPREMMVARMVTEGWPNKKIASKLFISEGTAKLHLHHVYQKLNCPGRMSLQRYMQNSGLM